MTDAALIFVADNNRLLQQAAVRVLSQARYRTCTADDGQSALRVARSEKPDLILLDVVLPDRSAPLRGIDGGSAALLEDNGPQLDAQGRQYLERVRGETQRMGA